MIYVVQWNLGGLTGPIKIKWNDEAECYVSECGEFCYDPDKPADSRIWYKWFSNLIEANAFVDGCKFTTEWFRERMKT